MALGQIEYLTSLPKIRNHVSSEPKRVQSTLANLMTATAEQARSNDDHPRTKTTLFHRRGRELFRREAPEWPACYDTYDHLDI